MAITTTAENKTVTTIRRTRQIILNTPASGEYQVTFFRESGVLVDGGETVYGTVSTPVSKMVATIKDDVIDPGSGLPPLTVQQLAAYLAKAGDIYSE